MKTVPNRTQRRKRSKLERLAASLATAVLLAILCAFLPTVASADPVSPASPEQVFTALGVDQIPADVDVNVDVSLSMNEQARYSQVVAALRPFLQSLSPHDYLALSRFGVKPVQDWAGPVGDSPDAVLARLPLGPTDDATDIGKALDEAVGEFERPGANDTGVLVFLTDGRHEPPPGSPYPSTSGPDWDALAARGAQVSKTHTIASYAVALSGDTDAALVSKVFPNTKVINLPPEQIGPFLQRVKDEVQLTKAKSILTPDLGYGVTATWHTPTGSIDLNSQTAHVQLTLNSSFTHIPATVTNLTSTATGFDGLKLSGLPDSVSLQPGESKTFDVTMSFNGVEGFGFGKHDITSSGQLQVACTLESPWTQVIQRDLQLAFTPGCKGAAATITGTGVTGTSWWLLIALVLLPLLLVAGLWWSHVNRQPRMKGYAVATVPGQAGVRSAALSGRKATIGSGKGSRLKIPGHGELRGVRLPRGGKRRGFDLGLSIRYSANGKAPRKATVKPNHSVSLDGVTFTYQSSTRSTQP